MNTTLKLAAGSLAISFIVLGLKFLAYSLTGSIALYSDALESIVKIVTAVVALLAVRLAAKPECFAGDGCGSLAEQAVRVSAARVDYGCGDEIPSLLCLE
jgi:hypothetical protein